MEFLAPGLHNISAEAYHSDPCERPSLSSTIAKKLLAQSPLHAWTASPRLNPDYVSKDSKTFDIGRAAHRAILGKGEDFVAIPEAVLAANGAASTKEAKAFIAEAREAGLTPLKADDVAAVDLMASSVKRQLALMGITLSPDRSEMVAVADIDSIMCRAMIDNAPADNRLPLYDLKTTTDASPEAITRAVEAYGYDVQAAHYLDVWEAATGERRKFRFIFVEKEPPFACSVIQLFDDVDSDADWMGAARSKAKEARRIWGECLKLDYWPGYPARVQIIGARGWEQQRWADKEIGMPVAMMKPSPEAIARAAKLMQPEETKQ